MDYKLGIVGGLGPLATVYFYELLTTKTKVSKDQDHLDIIILSHPSTPDRTEYILNNNNPNPYNNLLNDCKTLKNLGCKLISIPCNTASYFTESLQKQINIPISNIVTNTVNYLKRNNYKNAVLMATTGTIKSKLYQNALERENIKCIFPSQDKVMKIIYEYIKKGKKVPLDLLKDALKNTHAECVILGCTELSILKKQFDLSDKFIDPLEIETEIILNYFNKERK